MKITTILQLCSAKPLLDVRSGRKDGYEEIMRRDKSIGSTGRVPDRRAAVGILARHLIRKL
jgi:hypothetical protein